MFVIQQGGSRSESTPRITTTSPTDETQRQIFHTEVSSQSHLLGPKVPVSYKHIQKKRRPPIHIRLVRSFVRGCHGSLPVHFRSFGDATTS